MENKELEYVAQAELVAEEAEHIELDEETLANLTDNKGDDEDVEQSTSELHEDLTEQIEENSENN